MKVFLVLVLTAVAVAAPQQSYQDVQLLRYDNINAGSDGYSFAYELSNGQKHEEKGQVKNRGSDHEAISVQGQYSWVGPDGVTYLITYVADENGYQPQIQQGPGGSIPPAVIDKLVG